MTELSYLCSALGAQELLKPRSYLSKQRKLLLPIHVSQVYVCNMPSWL